MDEYIYNPVYELWQHLDSRLWHFVDKNMSFHLEAFSTGCREASFSIRDGGFLLSWKSLHPFDTTVKTGQANMHKVYCFYIKSAEEGQRQVLSVLTNRTSQSYCICRMKQVMLGSQHPFICVSGFLTQAQLYSSSTDWMLIGSWVALGSLQECIICVSLLPMEYRQQS